MPNASSATDIAGPSAMTESAADAWSLTPAEAGAVLTERSADFAAPVPSAEQVQDAYDARLRLAALTNDPRWSKAFMEGGRAERAEFEQLTQAITNESEAQGDTFVQAPIELTVGDQSTRRQDVIAEISHLGKVGIPEAGMERTLPAISQLRMSSGRKGGLSEVWPPKSGPTRCCVATRPLCMNGRGCAPLSVSGRQNEIHLPLCPRGRGPAC
jgi:hypothetical protein